MAIRITRHWRRIGECLIIVGDICLLYFDIATLEGVVSVVIAVVATIILLATVTSIFWPLVRKQLLKRLFHGVEVFEMRQDAPDFKDEIRKPECRYVWALWHSGSIANRQATDIGNLDSLVKTRCALSRLATGLSGCSRRQGLDCTFVD